MSRCWPERCSLMGCDRPALRPHHHHWWRGHLDTRSCQCPQGGEPGTSSTEQERE